MRNLKRVLSLTMASAMLMGMMVVGAGAADKTYADLTDKDQIENKEAVSLLVDLGIVEGTDKGTYNPTGVVDRATMAKFITYIMMGDVDQSNFTGTTSSLKDIDGNWAEGYIKYCAANSIIVGDNNGNFTPSGEVTTVSAAKMILVALGYDPEGQGYQNNANWSANIMRDAQKAGLLDNMGVKANAGLTRDDAAQLIYNGLMANTVTNEYAYDQGNQYVARVTENPTTLGLETYGLVKISGKVEAAGEKSTTIETGLEGIGTRAFDIVVPGSTGKTVTIYAKYTYSVKDGEIKYNTLKEIYSSEGIVVDSAVLGTSKDGTSLADLTNTKKDAYIAGLDEDTKDDKGVVTPGVTYYYNGEEIKAADASVKAGDLVLVKGEPVKYVDGTDDVSLLGNGVLVTFVDNDSNGKADVVDIVAYVAAKVTAYSTKDDGSISFNKKIGDATKWDAEDVIGFSSLEKDDYVLLTYASGKVTAMKADTAEGTVSGKNTGKGTFTVDGTAYKVAANTVPADGIKMTDMNIDDEVTLYLDPYGYIVNFSGETASNNEDYVFVSANDASGMSGTQTKVYFSDGTNEVVTVDKYYAKAGGTSTTEIGKGDLAGKIYTFTVKSGKYNLTLVTGNAKELTAGTTYTAKKGIASLTAGDTNSYANNNTLFVDVKNGKTYTGYKNLPGTLNFTDGAILYKDEKAQSGLMQIVYMSDGIKASTGSTDELVIFDKAAAEQTNNADGDPIYTLTSAILNGEVLDKEIVLSKDAYDAINSKNGIYSVTEVDTDGTITEVVLVTDTDDFGTKKTVETFGDGALKLESDNTIYTVDEDTIYVEIDVDDSAALVDGDSISTDAGSESQVIVRVIDKDADNADATTAQYVYIIK